MKCLKCNREFVHPLELFTGSFACPKCKTTLFDVSSKVEFKITEENEEQYLHSEILYHKALKTDDKNSFDKYIKEAIELCKQSAKSYNPKAMLRLAYYYDYDYIDKNRSELDRCKIAKSYYRSICFGDLNNISIIGDIDAPNIREIKEHAAALYFNMLESLDADNKESLGQKQIDADKLKLSKQYPSIIHGYDSNNVTMFDHNTTLGILDILKTCSNKKNPPMFGSFKMNINEARSLFTTNNNEIIKYIKKGCDIYVVDDVNGIMDPDSRFIKLNMLSIIKSEILNKDRNDLYIVFVNSGAKMSFLEGLAIRPILKQLRQDNFDALRIFVTDINGSSFTLSKDDLSWKNYKLKELLEEAKVYL
jgi:hypothetical protein